MTTVKFFEEFCQEFSKILVVLYRQHSAGGQWRASGGDVFAKMKVASG